jgi:hypothetical protein
MTDVLLSSLRLHANSRLQQVYLHQLDTLSDRDMPSALSGFRHAADLDDILLSPRRRNVMSASLSRFIPQSLLA